MIPFQVEKLNDLTSMIGTQLSWGPAVAWRGSDFEQLSELIFDRTGKRLSVTTLKRLWGRAALESNPSPTTLDILAEFAGFDSWRDFCKMENGDSESHDKWRRLKILCLVSVIPLIGIAFYFSSDKAEAKPAPPLDLDQISFELEKVTAGYPNTVIFKYDLGTNFFDSMFIQQSWDQNRRITLKDSSGLVTSTYYYPGYYLTKLVVDGQVVVERELYIPTTGWQGMIAKDSDIHYLKEDEIIEDPILAVSDGVLETMNDQQADYLFLANLSEEPQINSDRFDFEVDFRLSEAMEGSICKGVQMVITGTREVLGFKFALTGCAGDLMFFLNQDMIFGKEHDLSAFGITPGTWTNFKLENERNLLTVWMNNVQVFTHQMKSDIGKIGGVQWFFEGSGEIKNLKIIDRKHVVKLVEGG